MTIGETIRRLRKEKGLTQDALADALEISRQAIAKWESGQSLPSTGNLLKLAQLLDVSPDELTGGGQSPPSALEQYARRKLEEDRKKREVGNALFQVLCLAAGYFFLWLLCLAVFYLAGIKNCIWGWMQDVPVLFTTWLFHGAFLLLDRRRAGAALFWGTVCAIVTANIAGLAARERSPIGWNNGWVIYLSVLFAACAIGLLLDRRAQKPDAAVLTRRRRAAGAALAAALSLLFLACVFLSVRHVQYGLGAEAGYRQGYAAGAADAAAGKPSAPGLSADHFPANYTFGSSAYKGYTVYWSAGYNAGYDSGPAAHS